MLGRISVAEEATIAPEGKWKWALRYHVPLVRGGREEGICGVYSGMEGRFVTEKTSMEGV